jgi:hypothetical protein
MSLLVAGSLSSSRFPYKLRVALLGTSLGLLVMAGCGVDRSASRLPNSPVSNSDRPVLRPSDTGSASPGPGPRAEESAARETSDATTHVSAQPQVVRTLVDHPIHGSAIAGNIGWYLGGEVGSVELIRGHTGLMPYSISCANTTMTGAGTDSCVVTMDGVALNSIDVRLSSSDGAVVVPASIIVARETSSAAFNAVIASVSSAKSVKLIAATTTGSKNLTLQLNPPVPPSLSAISCANSSLTGAASTACTVTLSAAAPSGGAIVSLSSNDAAVAVPANVSVQAATTSAGFTAAASTVTTAQTATITAALGATTETFALQLSPVPIRTLSANATSVSFGGVVINSAATQAVTLSSTGNSTLTVSSATATGSGFSVSGATFPLALNSGQTATLNVQFDPGATGAVSGQLAISSNATTGAAISIGLSGTGEPHEVALAWTAPASSSDPVSGYHIYRAPVGSSSFQLLSATLDTQTAYTDSTGQSGGAYQYYVTSVDSSGKESVPSNTANATLP